MIPSQGFATWQTEPSHTRTRVSCTNIQEFWKYPNPKSPLTQQGDLIVERSLSQTQRGWEDGKSCRYMMISVGRMRRWKIERWMNRVVTSQILQAQVREFEVVLDDCAYKVGQMSNKCTLVAWLWSCGSYIFDEKNIRIDYEKRNRVIICAECPHPSPNDLDDCSNLVKIHLFQHELCELLKWYTVRDAFSSDPQHPSLLLLPYSIIHQRHSVYN